MKDCVLTERAINKGNPSHLRTQINLTLAVILTVRVLVHDLLILES